MAERLPLRILLAEDNAVNQKVALRILQQMGYGADIANNGLEAIEALERRAYDVVLMDVQMPEMDGLEATQRIRSTLPDALQPRIIAMTANAMQGDRDECFAAGMDDYISKPFKPVDVVRALDKCRPLATESSVDNGTTLPSAPLAQQLVVQPISPNAANELEAQPAASAPGSAVEASTNGVAADAILDSGASIGSDAAAAAAVAAVADAAPVPAEDELPIFDPDGLQQLRDVLGQKADELLPSLMDSFFDEAPRLIATARQALEQGRANEVRRAAHTLKSNSRDFGASALAEVARDLEARSKEALPDDASQLIERMEQEFIKAKPALEDARGRIVDGNA
jgi:CheY-like chemotaxis protein